MTVGERIKERRLALGKSAEEVAEQLGRNRATMYRYENNDIENLPAKVLSPLADALETTPGYLMGWTDDPYDYDKDPNDILSNVPCAWLDAWRREGISNAEIWRRYDQMHDSLEESRKTPDTFIDVEGLSTNKRALVDFVMGLSDEEAEELLSFARIYHSKKR